MRRCFVADVLDALDEVIGKLKGRAFFGKPAKEKAIAGLEKKLGRKLPGLHRAFLRRHDGGFINISRSEDEKFMGWNSNTFLSVKEIAKEFETGRHMWAGMG